MARNNQSSEARDLYQEVTDRIVAALETGVAPWTKPWACVQHANATTGKAYRGINQILLMITAAARDYQIPLWLTFNQARELGGTVKKGERGTTVIFWRIIEKEATEGQKPQKIVILRSYTVFNVAQTTVEASAYTRRTGGRAFEAHAEAEALIERSGASISHGGDRACYIPSTDAIRMPERASFESAASYYSTMFHELTHWTSHESRCARELGGRFGDEAYAAEELVAELGAAFLCARHGITGNLQHPQYIGHWIKVLKNDKRAIFTAASAATKAADFLSAESSAEEEEMQEAA